MQIIGITGAIGHGKTSLAKSLARIEPNSLQLESSQLLIELANLWRAEPGIAPKPNDLSAINNWVSKLPPYITRVLSVICQPGQLEISAQAVAEEPLKFAKLFSYLDALNKKPELTKEPITAKNKAVFRPILQWLGSFLAERVGSEVLYSELIRRAKNTSGIKLCTIGGLRYPSDADVIKRAGGTIVNIVRPSVAEADSQDPTEALRHSIVADVTIVNDGSLKQLEHAAAAFYSDLKANKQQTAYQGSQI